MRSSLRAICDQCTPADITHRSRGQAGPRAGLAALAHLPGYASPWAAKIYNDTRTAGKVHPHAVRILARARIPGDLAVLDRRHPYDPANDPARHGAAAALAEKTAGQYAV